MVEAYYCLFLVYGLYVQYTKRDLMAGAVMLLLEMPIFGRVFGVW